LQGVSAETVARKQGDLREDAMDDEIRCRLTPYGFQYGAAEVERLFSDKGRVVIGIRTPRQEMQIVVSRTGLIRVLNVKKAGKR
jgi:hypothetical protein